MTKKPLYSQDKKYELSNGQKAEYIGQTKDGLYWFRIDHCYGHAFKENGNYFYSGHGGKYIIEINDPKTTDEALHLKAIIKRLVSSETMVDGQTEIDPELRARILWGEEQLKIFEETTP